VIIVRIAVIVSSASTLWLVPAGQATSVERTCHDNQRVTVASP
jgi:hypothetical protein